MNWGMAIVRTELKEIDPPQDVQETMNKVVKAENEKVAALDFANAVERQADGEKRAEIKKAEGVRQAKILAAEGEAQAIKLVNEAANTYFVGNAQLLRKLEALEKALSHNAKIVVPSGCELVNVIGEMAGVLPLTDGNGRGRAEEGQARIGGIGAGGPASRSQPSGSEGAYPLAAYAVDVWSAFMPSVRRCTELRMTCRLRLRSRFESDG